MLDAIIVGGGPAGLNAGLVLGRCRRQVHIFDSEQPRNAASHALHGFLTRDGIAPDELRRLGREQLQPYDSVAFEEATVSGAEAIDDGFAVRLEDGRTLAARTLLLATGVVDLLPGVPGFADFYGRGVFHCPYCDGWEVRDRPLVAYGPAHDAARLGLELTTWSRDVTVCTGGQDTMTGGLAERLERNGVKLREQPVRELAGRERLERVTFRDGSQVNCGGLFFVSHQLQHSPLVEALGCDLTSRGVAATRQQGNTNIPGLFVAGDASRRVQLASVAAAEGVEAAFAINTELLKRDLA